MSDMVSSFESALGVVKRGGVIAYPTEYCYGLGCDPANQPAVERILEIKRRERDKGLIVIASSEDVVDGLVELKQSANYSKIHRSWPGANTWLLPAREHVGDWLTGRFSTLAVRIPDHSWCLKLCDRLQTGLVSTSANRQGEPELLDYQTVLAEFSNEVDLVIDEPVGGRQAPSIIRDSLTGVQLR